MANYVLHPCTLVSCRRGGQCFPVLRTRHTDVVGDSSGRSYVTERDTMCHFCAPMVYSMKQKLLYLTRCRSGNTLGSNLGGPEFKSRSQPTWLGFFMASVSHQSKCWVGFSWPRSIWPLLIKFINHKINISKLTNDISITLGTKIHVIGMIVPTGIINKGMVT